jgi:hypothetical protein
MDEIIEFVKRFIDAEFRALRASYLEGDEQKYGELVRNAEAMLESRPGWPMSLGFGRAPNPDTQWLESMRTAAEQFVPRALFVVRRVEHPVRGPLYVAIVSSTDRDGGGEYDERWAIEPRGSSPRIVARQTIDFRRRDRVVWDDAAGEPVDIQGPIVEERRLVEPDSPLHRADWSSGL